MTVSPGLRPYLRSGRLVVGLTITVLITLLAIVGPWIAPHGQYDIVGRPFTADSFFGTDYLGQDVFSRVLAGGRSILLISLLATVLERAGQALRFFLRIDARRRAHRQRRADHLVRHHRPHPGAPQP